MIGPLRPGGSFLTVADFAGTPVAPAVTLVAQDGVVAIARSTSGIVNMGGNTRAKVLTVPVTTGEKFYFAQWDDNGGTPFSDEAVWVTDAVRVAPALTGPGTTTEDYTVANPFKMKRGDTVPQLSLHLEDIDGNPYVIPGTATVKFTVQPRTALNNSFGTATIQFHGTMVAGDDGFSAGHVVYNWAPGDVSWVGDSYIEVEVTAGSTITSFPGATASPEYIPMTVLPDEDPGINP